MASPTREALLHHPLPFHTPARSNTHHRFRKNVANGLAEHRRAAQWQVEIARDTADLFGSLESQPASHLHMMTPQERVNADYAGTSITTGPHPMALAREKMPQLWRAADLQQARNGERVLIGGMVICRQRPGSAKGFVFVSVEASPVVPQATSADEPPSICQSTSRRNAFSSNDPSRKGVTRAGIEPENMDFTFALGP